VLVDTGLGDKQDDKFFSHYHPHGDKDLIDNLRKLGVDAGDITDVFLTHLHFDHCGGAIKRAGDALVPTFPKANYWSNADHWAWAVEPNAREKASFLKENILPIEASGQLQFVKSEGIWEGLFDIYYVYGHTEAMMLPCIEVNGKKVLFCADLIPSVAHISMAWVMGYDMRPLETLNEKARLLEKAVSEGWILCFEHDAYNEACTLVRTEKGIKAGTIAPLAELLA
jgi:glyoxylase-like metal-dependent hydrolase (beta-lactamase superfamily II)